MTGPFVRLAFRLSRENARLRRELAELKREQGYLHAECACLKSWVRRGEPT